jgi:hypothetical protein
MRLKGPHKFYGERAVFDFYVIQALKAPIIDCDVKNKISRLHNACYLVYD